VFSSALIILANQKIDVQWIAYWVVVNRMLSPTTRSNIVFAARILGQTYRVWHEFRTICFNHKVSFRRAIAAILSHLKVLLLPFFPGIILFSIDVNYSENFHSKQEWVFLQKLTDKFSIFRKFLGNFYTNRKLLTRWIQKMYF
jgi:hypothetical protein